MKGIQQDPTKYEPLYQAIIEKSWNMLNTTADYQIKGNEGPREKYKYNIVTILRVLGTISPLIRLFQTSTDLQKFFSTILTKCSKKI